jgi:hypothetical protein
MPTECIARNYYEIAFQPAKNRVYLTITGFWGIFTNPCTARASYRNHYPRLAYPSASYF